MAVVRGLFAGVIVLLQFAALYWPSPPSGPQTDLPLDKIAHVVIFAVPTVVLLWAGLPWVWTLVLMGSQIVASEAVQALMSDRSAEIGDLVADVVGVAIGMLLGWSWLQRRSKSASPTEQHSQS